MENHQRRPSVNRVKRKNDKYIRETTYESNKKEKDKRNNDKYIQKVSNEDNKKKKRKKNKEIRKTSRQDNNNKTESNKIIINIFLMGTKNRQKTK